MRGMRGTANALTKRERTIAMFLSCGASYAVIAQELGIAPETVRWHAKRIYKKCGVSSRRGFLRRFRKKSNLGRIADKLSPRECDVASRLIEGMTRFEASESLGVSVDTVNSYARSIFCKLGIATRDELYRLVY